MQQPKFTFGDKVELIDSNTIFTVSHIYFDRAGVYRYSSDEQCFAHEEDMLKLYVEPPRTKKVYQFIFKLEDQSPVLSNELWDSEEDFYSHSSASVSGYIEYIKLANTFEVPE